MANPLEKMVEAQVCDYAESKNCEVLKLNLKGRRGWPDRLFIFHGKVLFIEFKRLGEQLTSLQKFVHGVLQGHGMRVEVVDDHYKGRRLIDELTNGG